jgi:hypothetical protein
VISALKLDRQLDHFGMLAGQIGLGGEPYSVKVWAIMGGITSVKSSSDQNGLPTKRDGHHIS